MVVAMVHYKLLWNLGKDRYNEAV